MPLVVGAPVAPLPLAFSDHMEKPCQGTQRHQQIVPRHLHPLRSSPLSVRHPVVCCNTSMSGLSPDGEVLSD
eukprot:12888020-Prorocentrum_lima.AAC.1